MLALRLAPALLALLVLGAHFFRAQAWLPFGAIVVLLAITPLKRRWVAWLWQAALVVGAIEWIRTLVELVALRQSLGQPWFRLCAILGAVAFATLLSALVFRVRVVRRHYTPTLPANALEVGSNTLLRGPD